MARDIVLLHGFTNTGASWNPVVAALGERYRALAPDIRGHGTRSELEPVTLDAVLDDLAGLATERFTLVGYSMGGRIALHAAIALGDRIDRLVLIGASPGLADPSEREARKHADDQLADQIEGLSIEEFAARWAQTPVLAGQPREVAAAAHADRVRNRPQGLARALRGLGTGALPSLWERLGEIAAPVTLVVGADDGKFTEIATRMATGLRHPDVILVERAGHAVHLEAPARVAAAIERGKARRPEE